MVVSPEEFVERWSPSGGMELANSQPFLLELCDLLGVERPAPSVEEAGENRYVFERGVTFNHADGSTSFGRIDLYKQGCFVLESKQSSKQHEDLGLKAALTARASAKRRKGTAVRGTRGWDDAMIRAREQAERYAKAVPAADGWPPFLVVVDVGNVFELFADFTGTGKNYSQFPDARSFRIKLADLTDPAIRERLRRLWEDPMSLDPTRLSARVTREIADNLARLAKSLEASGRAPKSVADFLMRCLFTMFAEDVELLPKDSFTKMLKERKGRAETFAPMAQSLWETMNKGGFFSGFAETLLQFNGGFFAKTEAIPLDEEQLELLLQAALADWRHVEPAIFGTLVERALDPRERHKLGAHYTPRAYVERLVMPTVIEPLREEWTDVRAAAVALAAQGDEEEALAQVRDFHQRLCALTFLDPACGTGNFLYVTMEHVKRLEGEVLDLAMDLGQDQYFLEMEKHTVDPHQFLGLELNPRAVPIAELVLWIGHLQWHFKTRGKSATPAQPVLKNFHNIKEQDAVLAYADKDLLRGEDGKPLTRWDGFTTKPDPLTGREVPDETATVELYKYSNPKRPTWPEADYIIGNPPFIGGKGLRAALGDGYAEALWKAHADMPNSADFVMYWWNMAANRVREGRAQRFGFITTNSLRQTFNRRVLDVHMKAGKPLSLLYAVPDHPWVDSTDGAAVRIAMTVGAAGLHEGRLDTVVREDKGDHEGREVELEQRVGLVFPDLTVGVDVTGVEELLSNDKLSCPGVKLHGSGFIVTPEQAENLGLGTTPGLEALIRPYRNGRDLTAKPRGVMVIDLFGLTAEEVRARFPKVYQWVYERVKPERDHNKRESRRLNWWIFGEPISTFRPALRNLPRYIATVETAKHRVFQFLDATILPDNKLINIALDDAWFLGVLSSHAHVVWALASGSHLGVGNDPVYAKSRCFDPFPFPDATDSQKARIRDLGEQLDAFRKARQAEHPDLTLTDMYNVLEKLKSGEDLSAKEKTIHEQGLVSTLKSIHEDLDKAVLVAYGWAAGSSEAEILANLVALNKERAEEERAGRVRWLRPEFQAPKEEQKKAVQDAFALPEGLSAKKVEKRPWPKTLPEQIRAVSAVLVEAEASLDAAAVAKTFQGARKDKVAEVLDALAYMGRVRKSAGERFAA